MTTAASLSAAERLLPGASLGTFRLPDEVAFIAAHGAGAQLTSTDGRRYIDYVLGSGPMVVGHAHPRVVEAVTEQAARGATFYALNEPAIRLAEQVTRLLPCAESLKYAGSGGEATLYALRIARAQTGRTKVLKFEGAYHGANDYALHGMRPGGDVWSAVRTPDSAGVPAALAETVIVTPYNDLQTVRERLEAEGDQVAAVLVEPVQRSIEPVPGFLAGLRELCDQTGALLVFDEIVTGFRLAPGGAQELYGVTPDLCTIGKALGGGLALAAVAGPHDLIALASPTRAEPGVYISGTLNGNPLAAAAGLATLEVLEEGDGWAAIAATGEALRAALLDAARQRSMPLRLIGPPSFMQPVFGGAEIVDARSLLATDRAMARAFCLELVRRGVFVPPAGKLYISTAHTAEHVEQTAALATEALDVIRQGA